MSCHVITAYRLECGSPTARKIGAREYCAEHAARLECRTCSEVYQLLTTNPPQPWNAARRIESSSAATMPDKL